MLQVSSGGISHPSPYIHTHFPLFFSAAFLAIYPAFLLQFTARLFGCQRLRFYAFHQSHKYRHYCHVSSSSCVCQAIHHSSSFRAPLPHGFVLLCSSSTCSSLITAMSYPALCLVAASLLSKQKLCLVANFTRLLKFAL